MSNYINQLSERDAKTAPPSGGQIEDASAAAPSIIDPVQPIYAAVPFQNQDGSVNYSWVTVDNKRFSQLSTTTVYDDESESELEEAALEGARINDDEVKDDVLPPFPKATLTFSMGFEQRGKFTHRIRNGGSIFKDIARLVIDNAAADKETRNAPSLVVDD